MNRCIFHVDVNSAFLSWSAVRALKTDPAALDLRTVPAIVGGDMATRHGVVTAKSIPAGKYGIRTGEAVASALRKCPGLILVRSDFQTYRQYSKAFIAILRTFSPVLEQISIDEAFLDMTEPVRELAETLRKSSGAAEIQPASAHDSAAEPALSVSGTASESAVTARDSVAESAASVPDSAVGSAPSVSGTASGPAESAVGTENTPPEAFSRAAELLAAQIRDEVRGTLGFTVNVGISENKLLAKMASDFSKPDRTHTLWPSEVPEKMWSLSIGSLFGCGEATAARLSSFGIRTIGDAAKSDLKLLQSVLGEKAGEYIFRGSRGISTSPVQSEREAAKSYSNEMTTPEDITVENFRTSLPPLLSSLSEHVARRMQRDSVRAMTVGIMVKTGEFRRHSRQTTLDRATNDADEIRATAETLMDQLLLGEDGLFRQHQTLRLIGVSAQNLNNGSYTQVSLSDWIRDREAELKMQKEERRKLAAAAAQAEADAQKAKAAALRQKKLDLMMLKVREHCGDGKLRKGIGRNHSEGSGYASGKAVRK